MGQVGKLINTPWENKKSSRRGKDPGAKRPRAEEDQSASVQHLREEDSPAPGLESWVEERGGQLTEPT